MPHNPKCNDISDAFEQNKQASLFLLLHHLQNSVEGDCRITALLQKTPGHQTRTVLVSPIRSKQVCLEAVDVTLIYLI